METQILIKENWLTQKPKESAALFSILLIGLVLLLGASSVVNTRGAHDFMIASRDLVFTKGQYWRLWTSLFAHGGFDHLLGNALLFFPLSYLLMAHFSLLFFPMVAFLLGGLINAVVLQTMAPETFLIGISGVVYWMGAAWLTLFLLVDRRKIFKRRFAYALFLALMIFVPETYKPEVSYLSHFVGFIFGIGSAMIYYGINIAHFRAAEVKEYIYDDEFDWEDGQRFFGDTNQSESDRQI